MVPSKHHMTLDESGKGKCSVPMFAGFGSAAGFCDKEAYGNPIPREYYEDRIGRKIYLTPGYDGYVPGLACPCHGGPKGPTK